MNGTDTGNTPGDDISHGTPPAPPVAGPDISLIGGFLAASLALLADWLFYGHPLGWGMGAFAFLLLLAIWIASPTPTPTSRGTLVGAIAILGLCIRCIYEPNVLSLILLTLGLLTFGLARREGWTPSAGLWFLRWLETLSLGWLESWKTLGDVIRLPFSTHLAEKAARKFRLALIPLLLGGVFLALLAYANPLIGRALSRFWSGVSDWSLPRPSISHILSILFSGTLIATLLCYVSGLNDSAARCGTAIEEEIDAVCDRLLPRSVILYSLVAFNILFAVQTTLDLIYLWGGTALPEGMTYAEYAQRGAYPLVVAALLAGAFVLVAIPSQSDPSAMRKERKLVYLWLAQTLLLVVSAAWRLCLYIGAFSLTRLRFAATVWMLLVVLGLICVVIRIVQCRSGRWLVNINAVISALVLYGCALSGTDAWIAWFNVRHCEEVLGEGYPALDANYLIGLEEAAIPALLWIHQRYPDHENEAEWRNAISEASIHLDRQVTNWRGWTLLRQRAHADWSDWNRNREDRFSYGKVFSVSEDLLILREYDFAKDMNVDVTYKIKPETEFGNIKGMADLRAGDDVVLDYGEDGHQRTVTTLVREEKEEPIIAPTEPPLVPAPPPLPETLSSPLSTELVPPIELESCTATGRVVALRSGKIIIRVPGDFPGTTTNQDYRILSRAEFRGIKSPAKLQLDQRITFRHVLLNGKPSILEIAARGAALTGQP